MNIIFFNDCLILEAEPPKADSMDWGAPSMDWGSAPKALSKADDDLQLDWEDDDEGKG